MHAARCAIVSDTWQTIRFAHENLWMQLRGSFMICLMLLSEGLCTNVQVSENYEHAKDGKAPPTM